MACRCCEYTRLIAQWLMQDEACSQRFHEAASQIRRRPSTASRRQASREMSHDAARRELARRIHDELWTDDVMLLAGWQGDLLRSALAEVDCHAIAEEYLARSEAVEESRHKKGT